MVPRPKEIPGTISCRRATVWPTSINVRFHDQTVLTDVGPVDVRVPRDVAGTFKPQIVRKRQRRLTGVDALVLSLSARGLTHGEIAAHLAEVYGTELSKRTTLRQIFSESAAVRR